MADTIHELGGLGIVATHDDVDATTFGVSYANTMSQSTDGPQRRETIGIIWIALVTVDVTWRVRRVTICVLWRIVLIDDGAIFLENEFAVTAFFMWRKREFDGC
jgi:hypothetical protein